jgi:hypothetical protein
MVSLKAGSDLTPIPGNNRPIIIISPGGGKGILRKPKE